MWIEDERKRLLGLFDDQARFLRRLVAFFLIPALLFGILIFVPFTRQVTSLDDITAELESAQLLHEEAQARLEAISAVDSLAEALRLARRLRRDAEARRQLWDFMARPGAPGVDRVRAWAAGSADIDAREIPGLTEQFRGDEDASDCVWLDDRRWRDCFPLALGAGLYVGRGGLIYPNLSVHPSLSASLGAGLDGVTLDGPLAQELIDTLVALDRAIREDIPPLLRLMDEPATDWDHYNAALGGWEMFRHRLNDRQREARAEAAALARDTARLTANLESAERLIETIERSGGTFETPLGPLPLGIRELVLLYPTIQGVAYLLCLWTFIGMLDLRRGIHDLIRRPESPRPMIGMEHLALSAPLWYEPHRPLWRQSGRAILAIVPLGFMAWSYVALRSGLTGLISDSDSRFGARWYEVFLLLTLAGVLLTLARVVLKVMAHRKPAPQSVPDR